MRGYVDTGWKLTRWWRAIAPDGSLWVESSDEREVREHARPGDTVQSLWSRVITEDEWRDA